PKLITAIKDPDVSLRVNAVITLGFVGLNEDQVRQGVDALKQCLRDTQGIVRYQAAEALNRLGAPQGYDAIPSLIAATQDNSSWEIRRAAVNALGSVGWDPIANSGFHHNSWVAVIRRLKDPCFEVRVAALISLIIFGKPTSATDQQIEERAI